jgi:hypothetical protein
MTEADNPVLAAAMSDAEFDGRPWASLGRVDRGRYLARATKAHAAAIRQAHNDALDRAAQALPGSPYEAHRIEAVTAILKLKHKHP